MGQKDTQRHKDAVEKMAEDAGIAEDAIGQAYPQQKLNQEDKEKRRKEKKFKRRDKHKKKEAKEEKQDSSQSEADDIRNKPKPTGSVAKEIKKKKNEAKRHKGNQ